MTEEVKISPDGVPFVFGDGRERRMKFTYRSLCRMEREQKIGIEQFQKMLTDRINISDLGKVIWAALTHEDPALTTDQVEELLPLDRIDELSLAILETAKLSLPKPKKAEAQEPSATDSRPAAPAASE
jgi:hypothetical protein